MQVQTIEIKSIIVDEKIQQRADLNEDYVDELSIAIAEGANLPPLDVYDIDGDLLLTDGFHRLKALLKAGIDTVEVNIFKGTKRDAILHAIRVNAKHGLRFTNADKRKAVTTLLEEWGNLSDGQIAEICCVSQPFVSKVSNELTQNGFERTSQRLGKDGRSTDTANIGAKPQTDESEDLQALVEGGAPMAETEPVNTDEKDQTQNPEEDYAGAQSGSDSDDSDDMAVSENDGDIPPDSDSDDETGADDESSDQSEEDNIGPDGDNVDGVDESTPAASDEEESIPGSNPEELAAQVEDEDSEHDSADDSSSQEATEDAGEDNNPVESEADDSQVHSTEARETDEVQTLRAEIIELEKAIIEKDERIAELETVNTELQRRIQEYEDQEVSKDEIDLIEDFEPAGGLSGSTIY